MKKTISVVLALAMVFVMSLSAFAYSFDDELRDDIEIQGPDDVDGWTEYCMDVIGHLATSEDKEADQKEFVQIIVMSIQAGDMSPATAAKVIGTIAMSSVEGVDIQGLIQQIRDAIGELPSIEIPSELPSEFPSDITLPSNGGEGNGNGSFLDTILGALGGIIDGIFGGGDNEDPTTPSGDNTSGGDDSDLWGDGDGDDAFNDNSLGDTSVIAVAAVAVVAGAALVLTRKKSKDEDAE